MASKAPKKKESKEQLSASQKENNGSAQLSSSEERISGKRRAPIPLWAEWNDQDIANEKWDTSKKEKERGRSPTATLHCFDDPEGKIELPTSLRNRVRYWKRLNEISDYKDTVVVDNDHLKEYDVDLRSPNEHIADSELIRSIIATLNSLQKAFFPPKVPDPVLSLNRMKTTQSKDQKDSKLEKNKKDQDVFEDLSWKPWDLIWPKENAKINNVPSYNSCGKYAVKLFWMGCYRKIIVDDTVPCDENSKPLLPMTVRGNELWPLLIAKALIKVASLDYHGGLENSEFGDVNFIHCLTGWLPEQIPINGDYKERMWKVLLKILPKWKLPQPPVLHSDEICNVNKDSVCESVILSKPELSIKESKDSKNKKDDKLVNDKKQKGNEKTDAKNTKEKNALPLNASKSSAQTPDILVFATFTNPPIGPCKVSELKEMADASEKLRQFGLSLNLPHPVYLPIVRDCPLIPPPIPIQIPRWKLIRQKKKKEPIEPPCHKDEEQEQKFIKMKSLFQNFKVRSSINLNPGSPVKWDKFKPGTPMERVNEEDQINNNIHNTEEQTHEELINSNPILADDVEKEQILDSYSQEVEGSKARSFSISSQVSLNSSCSKKRIRSKPIIKDSKKTILKDAKSSQESKPPSAEPPVELLVQDEEDVSVCNEKEFSESETIPSGDKEMEKKDPWIHIDDFCQCFKTLWIYHRPKVNTKHTTEIKSFDSKSERSKKNAAVSIRNAVQSPTANSNGSGPIGDGYPPFLLVDCIKETEVLISFSSFSKWFDPNTNLNIIKEESEKQNVNVVKPVAGNLIVEPYSWKSVVISSPILRLRTTGIKATALTLPAGRHVLKVIANAPLGYHICVSLDHEFVFGDENSVLQHLTKESAQFIHHSKNILMQLGTIMQSFNDPLQQQQRHCKTNLLIGTEGKSNAIRRDHFDMLMKSLVKVMQQVLGDGYIDSMQFAMAALKYQAFIQLKKFPKDSTKSLPIKMLQEKRPFSSTGERKYHEDERKCSSVPAITTISVETDIRDNAATRIQALFRGYYTVKLRKAFIKDTPENMIANGHLKKIWSHIELNIENVASQVYHKMFFERPNLLKFFPFHTDEWNKISFHDYNGTYPEQPVNTFYLLFREIFHALEPSYIMSKFYSNVSSCHLKIINNDTYEEVKTVFMKVIPQTLHPNKAGYTIIVMGHSQSNIISAGKFIFRIIGEKYPLPISVRDVVNTNFTTKELQDYFIPDRYKRIFRHTVKVTEDMMTTMQFSTSKEDVYVKIQILDNDKEVYNCEGKGYIVIPCLVFHKDRFAPSEGSQKSSRPASQNESGRLSSKVTRRPPSSRRSASPEKVKRKSAISIEMKNNEDEIEEDQIHKYIIQGFVLRDSWPLTKKQWEFVETLKKPVIEEVEVELPSKTEATGKNSANRNRKKDTKGNRSRPESQTQNTFDLTKAHWNLRCIVDSNMENAIEIKHDTEREDEIKAIKAAWESLQPGRASKAQLSRLKYLESHTVTDVVETDDSKDATVNADVKPDEENSNDGDVEKIELESEEVLSATSPLPSEPDTGELWLEPPVKDTDTVLKTFDVTPYIRSSGKKILLNEDEEEKMRIVLQKKFSDFQSVRDMVLAMREDDRIARNKMKEQQLAEYEAMQLKLDGLREELYKSREAYRNKFLKQPEIEPDEQEIEKKKRTPSPKRNVSTRAGKIPSKTKKK